MPIKFDCKIISIDDVLNALVKLKDEHKHGSYSIYWIARQVLDDKINNGRYDLDNKERTSAESRVRRLLKKEEEKTGCVRNVSSKENKALWTIITPKQLQKEKDEHEERDRLEKEIIDWLASRDVDVEDDNIYISRYEVRIPIDEFKILMEMSK